MLNEEYRRNRCPVWIQLGLMREQIIVDPDISLPGLKEVACRFVDQMVRYIFLRFMFFF